MDWLKIYFLSFWKNYRFWVVISSKRVFFINFNLNIQIHVHFFFTCTGSLGSKTLRSVPSLSTSLLHLYSPNNHTTRNNMYMYHVRLAMIILYNRYSHSCKIRRRYFRSTCIEFLLQYSMVICIYLHVHEGQILVTRLMI